jgi:hypothetical protein
MITRLILIGALVSFTIAADAQVDGTHYWVVESNKEIPYRSIVKIYNQENALIHEVKLHTKLDVTNKRHRKVLTQMMRRYYQREATALKKTKSKSSV